MTCTYKIRIETRQTGNQTERDKYFEMHNIKQNGKQVAKPN